ncbi:hypothetical protein AXF42_Ash004585 [Apostasia shenzhenica]|uniref:Uncharacterized protein n=1 Tax=Apostasia shenzhenica TaxID=1088818 RepID=A0A2I0BH15_9ASPA|nr:hypothetical protein AXF42_Ash004585 [Apostasia shenzhenica]
MMKASASGRTVTQSLPRRTCSPLTRSSGRSTVIPPGSECDERPRASSGCGQLG